MKKINLTTAILININTIIGAGLFINPRPLTQLAGFWGFLGYLISFLILIPIVLSVANMAQLNPSSGGLYVYSKKYINPFIGFVSGWSYFLGKVVSATLLSHLFAIFLKNRLSFLSSTPILILDATVIFTLIGINILGINIGGKIQYAFASFKFIPIFFIIFTGISFFDSHFFTISIPEIKILTSLLPIAIFALTGFELICAIGHLIKNPEKNIKKAIISSFAIAVFTVAIVQIFMYMVAGNSLSQASTPIYIYATKVAGNFSVIPNIIGILVWGSILGSAFGSLITNGWNLFTLAENNHLPFKKWITKINKFDSPWVALISQGFLGIVLLLITEKQIPMQNMAVLGMISAYLFTSIAAFNISKKNNDSIVVPSLAILSSSYIIYLCILKLYTVGISFSFLSIFALGITSAYLLKNKKKLKENI